MPGAVALEFLPARPAFVAPLADPRSPRSAVLVHLADAERSFSSSLDASLAEEFPLLGLRFGETHALHAELWAGASMGFGGRAGLTFDLQTFDGAFGLAFDGRSGPWSARLEWMHESGHIADGFDLVAYEAATGVADAGARTYDATTTFSRERIVVRGARDWTWIRPYLGLAFTYHGADPGTPLRGQLGAEARGPWRVAPYVALDVAYDGELESVCSSCQEPDDAGPRGPSLHAQLGAEAAVDDHRLRGALAAAWGRDDAGRLRNLPEAYVGLLVGFDIYP